MKKKQIILRKRFMVNIIINNDSPVSFLIYKFLLNLIRSTRCLGNSQFMYRMATWLYDRYSENSFVIRDASVFRVFFTIPTTFLSLKLHIEAFPEFSIILNYVNLITSPRIEQIKKA